MEKLNDLKTLIGLFAALFIAGVVAGIYIHSHYMMKENTLRMMDFEKKSFVQQAYEDSISVDSLKKLLGVNQISIPVKKSNENFIGWQRKADPDTITIHDTVLAGNRQVEIDKARDTTFTWIRRDSIGNEIKIVETLQQSYVPIVRRFITSLSLDSLIINSKKIVGDLRLPEPFYKDHWFWATVVAVAIIIKKVI